MIALARLISVHGEPDRIRLTPQAAKPSEVAWVLKFTSPTGRPEDARGYIDFELTERSIKVLLAEAAEINARR